MSRGSFEALVRSAEDKDTANPGSGTSKSASQKEAEKARRLGVHTVGIHSRDEDIADWEKRMWSEQDDLVEEYSREWNQHLYYAANHQYITWHADSKRWLPRRTTPWKVRSVYNVIQKAIDIRVSRLTENKPTITVQSGSTAREDIERTELKERIFWSLWERLEMHDKIRRSRRWAAKTGIGFIKLGWDPDAGDLRPATLFVPEIDEFGNPSGQMIEAYVDAEGNPLAPKTQLLVDDEGGVTEQVMPAPPDTEYISDGDVFADIRSPFNVRWDRYVDDVWDSWYVQDAEVPPASRILAMFPDAMDKLERAEGASETDAIMSWQGLTPRVGNYEGQGFIQERNYEDPDSEDEVEKLYLVRETWIFPKNRHIKKLWGQKGAVLITVGGQLIRKQELPEWALRCCPFVPFDEIIEEGNHYNKAPIRDIIPLQDDINRSRSHLAEATGLSSRIILTAPQNHQVSTRALGGMPGVLVTYRQGAKPDTLDIKPQTQAAESFYNSSLAAAADLGNMNEASTGKLPSAGLAAKAIYALQYADERSITEVSNAQDKAIRRIAIVFDWITREHYTDDRKIRLVGEDRSYLVENQVDADLLQTDVDYFITPGSMLSRQKEAVKNELFTLLEAGLIQPWEMRRMLPTATPDAFRGSYDLHEAKARRQLKATLNGEQVTPAPWDDPNVHVQVLEEFMLGARWDSLDENEQAAVTMLWQAYRTMAMQGMAQADPGQEQGQPQQPQAPMPVDASGFQTPGAVQGMEMQAEAAQAPPEGFGAEQPPMM